MKSTSRIPLILVALVIGVPVVAEAQASLPKGVTAEMIAKGKEVYSKSGLCFACHGPDGKGTVGPNLTDDVWLHSKGSYEEIAHQVTAGVTKEESKSGVPMPPKGGSTISDDDVKAVAAYVWSLSHK
jgi:mono/diheme cytochrome c family protein